MLIGLLSLFSLVDCAVYEFRVRVLRLLTVKPIGFSEPKRDPSVESRSLISTKKMV